MDYIQYVFFGSKMITKINIVHDDKNTKKSIFIEKSWQLEYKDIGNSQLRTLTKTFIYNTHWTNIFLLKKKCNANNLSIND